LSGDARFCNREGARVEAGEGDLRDIFEENQEPADDDEERGPEADEKQLKKRRVDRPSSAGGTAAKAGIAFIRMDSEIQTLVRRAEEV
jgi:hypothetical protein